MSVRRVRILTDVDVILCARLDKGSTQFFGQFFGVICVDLPAKQKHREKGSLATTAPGTSATATCAAARNGDKRVCSRARLLGEKADGPVWQVDFGAYYYTWDGVHATEVDDLVVHDANHVEGFAVRDRVHEDIAMDANRVFGV